MIEKPKRTDVNSPEETIVKGLGFCGNAADSNASEIDVRDGKIIRIRPLHYDRHYKPEEFRPWKIEARGKTLEPPLKMLVPALSLAYKKRVYSPNRILYPLKRADFNPKEERNPQNRGKSKFVRISWEEALNIITEEINRIKDTYGPYAIFAQADGHGETKTVHGTHGCNARMLELLGGYTLQTRNTDSWEGWYWGAKHIWGMEPVGHMWPVRNLVQDVARNSQLLLFWGCDLETTPPGWQGQMASRIAYWFTDLGIKCIYICPDLNYAAAVHADKWIPIFPNTDAALQLAIAYLWIKEDTYDKNYLNTHSVGFDRFKDYVMGTEDGVPKTPQWAARLCGIPSRIIKALAHEWASRTTTIVHGCGGSMVRGPYSTEPARLEVTLLAMRGLGRPGVHQMNLTSWGSFGRPPDEACLPTGEIIPNMHVTHTGSLHGLPKQIIPKDLVHEAILNPPVSWYASPIMFAPVADQFRKYTYPAPGCSEIHMIWTDSPCWLNCWNGGNRFIQALRSPKIEFILAQHPWLENDCLFADIILPANTKLEEEDIGADNQGGQFNTLYYEKKCIEPQGESKSDYEIVCLIAERLGLLQKYTQGKSVAELIKQGWEKSGLKERISFQDLQKKGYYVVPTNPEWPKYPAGMYGFYAEPEKYPLQTPSGKIEIYSQRLAENFPEDVERGPYPRWVPEGESHQESRLGQRAQKYPLLLVSNHPHWRMHVSHDDVTWFREIPTCKVKGPDGYYYEPLWIHPVEAAKREIQSGDIVKLFNERGVVLGGAVITERIIPGVVYQDHGSRYDPIVAGELDRGGAHNTIAPHKLNSKNCTGMATSGFLVEVERVDLDGLRKKYPEAFNRPLHPSAGLYLESFLEKGK
jgi:molybdopterin guanine dinucleotide-containing S/N-oxide reductase-like protein